MLRLRRLTDALIHCQEQEGGISAPKAAADPCVFDFRHPLFAFKGSFFRMGDDGTTPLFYVCIGEIHAALPADRLARSFGLPSVGEDTRSIAVAVEGLPYVHEIRPGDSIPSELLDGSASWAVAPHHAKAAQARFFMQPISWLGGEPPQPREIGRARALILPPYRGLADLIAQIDADTEDLVALLKTFYESVAHIRQIRDELHQRLMKWDAILLAWNGATTEPAPANERLIRQTYQFLARHFSQARRR